MPRGSYLEEKVDTNIVDTLFVYLQTSGDVRKGTENDKRV
jgi:hypothetical protein